MAVDLLPTAHASGRSVGTKNAPADDVVGQSWANLAAEGALVISATEDAHRDVAAIAAKYLPGWHVAHHPGKGTGECAVLLHPDVEYRNDELVKLTTADAKATARFGMYRVDQYALKVYCAWKGRTFAVLVCHTPSHRVMPYARALWRQTRKALAAAAGPRTVVAADWNMDLRLHLHDSALRRHFPGKQLIAPTAATCGAFAIDGWMVPAGWGRSNVRVVDQGPGLDHKAVVVSLLMPPVRKDVPVTKPVAPSPAPYDLTTYDGKTVDWLTRTALEEAARRLGYDLTLMQGSYNKGGVGASAGTHDGGGAVDLAPWDYARKVRVLRDLGFAAWHRTPIPGVWGEHIHAVLIGNKKLAPAAVNQVSYYRAGLDGLADHAKDPDPYRPNPIPIWHMPVQP